MNKVSYNTQLDMPRIDGEQFRKLAFNVGGSSIATVAGVSGLGPEDVAIAVQNALKPSNETSISFVDTAYAQQKCDVTPIITGPNGAKVRFEVKGKPVGKEETIVNGQARARIVGDCTHTNPPVIEAKVTTTAPQGMSEQTLRFPNRAETRYDALIPGSPAARPGSGNRPNSNPGEFSTYDADGRLFLENPWQDFQDLGQYLGRRFPGFIVRSALFTALFYGGASAAESIRARRLRPASMRALRNSAIAGAGAEIVGRWFGYWR